MKRHLSNIVNQINETLCIIIRNKILKKLFADIYENIQQV